MMGWSGYTCMNQLPWLLSTEAGLSWKLQSCLLETRQLSDSWFGCMISGSLVAIFFSLIILIAWKFTCSSLACHSQARFTDVVSREVGRLVSNCILYRRLCPRFTLINEVSFLSNILRNEPANFTLLPSFVIWPRMIILLFKLGI